MGAGIADSFSWAVACGLRSDRIQRVANDDIEGTSYRESADQIRKVTMKWLESPASNAAECFQSTFLSCDNGVSPLKIKVTSWKHYLRLMRQSKTFPDLCFLESVAWVYKCQIVIWSNSPCNQFVVTPAGAYRRIYLYYLDGKKFCWWHSADHACCIYAENCHRLCAKNLTFSAPDLVQLQPTSEEVEASVSINPISNKRNRKARSSEQGGAKNKNNVASHFIDAFYVM